MGKGTWDELSKLINKYISRNKSKEGVVGIFTRKQIGNFPAVGSRMTNPLNRRDLALSEMTRERQYFLFKNYEKDVLKDIIKVLEHVDKNNIKLGGELLKNLEFNFGIVKMLRKYNLKSEGVIRSGGSTPSKVLKDEAGAVPGEGIRGLRGSAQDLQSSMDEIMSLVDDLRPETIAKKEAAEKAIRAEEFKKLYHGRAYEGRSDQYRGLSYQLAKLHEAGIIKLDDKIYKGIKEGKYHWGGAEFHTPDPNRVWRYHFGDEIFDKFDEVIEAGDDTFVGPKAMETWMKKEGIKPINVKGHKNALDYMDEVELLQNIKNNDAGIKRYKSGKDHFWSGMENEKENTMQAIMGLAEQNKKLLDIFKIKSPKNYDNYIKTKSQKPEKTFEEALKEGDFEVISEGDEGFKEISERLGITAKPGDNLKLDDNIIQGPWKGTKAPVTHQEKIDWLVKNVSQEGEKGIPPKETLEAMLKDGREDLIDHFYKLYKKDGSPQINIDTSDLKHPGLVKKIMTDEKLKPTLVKRDTLPMRLIKNTEKDLDPDELIAEGYSAEQAEILFRAREKMVLGQETNPNEALLRVKEEMADAKGVDVEDLDIDFEIDAPEPFAQGGRVGYGYGSGEMGLIDPDFDEDSDDMEEILRMLKQDQTGTQGTTDIASGELDDLIQRLGMVVDGVGIYSDYNQLQRKQMQRSLTSRINVLLAQ